MADSTSKLATYIRQKLPDFDDYDELLSKLSRLGVTELNDLQYLDWKDLVPPLTLVQAKKLLKKFSGDVSERDLYRLRERDQNLRSLEEIAKREANRMKYITDVTQRRVDLYNSRANKNKEFLDAVTKEVSTKNIQRNVGTGAYSAGVGAIMGTPFGPVGIAVGAGIGAAIGGGLGAMSSSTMGGISQDQTVIELMVAQERKVEELDKSYESKLAECKLDDFNELLRMFKEN